jgi:hypothetical protein
MVQDRDEMALNFGFDELPETTAILERPGVQLHVWGGPLVNIADKLGYKVERFEELYERCVAERDIEVAFGTITKGRVAAIRIRTSARIEGFGSPSTATRIAPCESAFHKLPLTPPSSAFRSDAVSVDHNILRAVKP